VHETLFNQNDRLTGGVAWTIHSWPFQRSTRALTRLSISSPTAVQARGEVQETP
jgi:hypothetical protein